VNNLSQKKTFHQKTAELRLKCTELTQYFTEQKRRTKYSVSKKNYTPFILQGGSNMTGTDLFVNKPHCVAAVGP